MSATEPGSLDRAYRADIDGLRALAILSVVLYHGGLPWLSGGFTGVDIFFVISGYLIGGHIYAQVRSGCFSYLDFYRLRAKRILPAFFAVLAFVLLAALLLLSPAEAAQAARSAIAATLSASNILFWASSNYFAPRSEFDPLLMTWSLGVEEQFYLVIPLLMVLAVRIRRKWILPTILAACALSFLFACSLLGRYPMMVFYTLPARAWELGAGVALAVSEINRKRGSLPAPLVQAVSVAGMASILAPIFLLTAVTPFPGAAALPSVLGTAVLIAVPTSWIGRRLLSAPPLAFLGRVSYSWYLWHWPLVALVRILYGGDPPRPALLAAIAVSLAVAILSYDWIEQPFRKSTQPAAPMLFRYGLVSLCALAVWAVLWLTHGLPQRFPVLAGMESAGHLIQSDRCLAADTDQPNLSSACYDSTATRPSVALWGDSHAAALAPALRSAANTQGYGFDELEKNSCTPLIGATHTIPRLPRLASSCLSFNRRVLELLEADPNIRIVVLTAAWSGPFSRSWMDGWLTADPANQTAIPSQEASRALFVQSLTATIRSLQGAGKQVVVLGDVPGFESDPMFRVRSAHIPVRRTVALWLGSQNATDPGAAPPDPDPNVAFSRSALYEAVAALPGVELISLRPALCATPGECAYREGDEMLFIDGGHLSPFGARYALRDFRFPSLAGAAE